MNRTWINLLVILSLLLSSAGINRPALAYTPSPSGPEATPGATPEATLTPTPATAPENGAYPPPEATPPLPTEPSPSPTPSQPTEPSPTPTPEESPPQAAWSISASANPAIYIPGKPLNIYWTITGDQPLPTSAGAQIRIIGVAVPEPGGEPLPEQELILPVTGMQGELTWEIEPYAEFPMYLTLDLLLENSVLDSEVIEIGVADQEVSSLEGGVIEGLGGKIRLEVPSAALEENAYFSVRYPSPNKTPAVSLTGMPIEIIAVGKDSGQNLTQFEQPIQIQIHYEPPELFNWSEDDLRVFYYNENDRDWYALPTQVDKENRLLTTHSDHLTVFDFKAATWQANTLPTVDSFKVSDFTGAATYSYTFQTPPGVAGLSPELSLEYNSQVMDEGSAYSQASWVGMGWSLDTGAITRNMHGTNDEKDDTFLISANGISGLLLPVSVNGALLTYNTADQSFLKVQFDSANNQWTAWSKDGRVYQYDKTAKTDTSEGCVTSGGALNLTWRWALGSVTDKNGNTINYTYDRDRKRDDCKNDLAIYPATITYSHDRYRVSFAWEVRSDYQNSWNEDAAMTLFSKRRLKEIRFEHAPSGNWLTPANITPVRKYVFGYAADDATTNVIYPNFKWTAGGHTLTLTSVQEISGDGSLSLPATTFYYGDEDGDGVDESMHLTRVDNGLGGQVKMQYTRWSYFDDFNDDLRSLLTLFGDANHECGLAWNYGTSWDAVTGSLACDPNADYDLHIWKASGQAVAWRTIPEHVIKPGSLYRFHITAKAVAGPAQINMGFYDGAALHMLGPKSVESAPTVLEDTLDMPASFDPSNTQLRLVVDGNILISKLQFMLFPLYYRVTSRTVTDAATGQQHTYTYRYDNPSANTAYTSAAVEAAGSDCSSLNTCAMREFRGHAVTQVTDPSGLTNVTWYYQSDALKGQPYHTMTVKQSFADDFEQPLSESTHWAVSSGVSDQKVIKNQDFDYALKAENTQSNWDVSIERSADSLNDGDTAAAQFRLSGAAAQAEVGLRSASGKFFGVLIQPNNGKPEARLRYDAGAGLQTGAVLIDRDHFQLDRWYVIKLSLDQDDGFKVRLWRLDDPTSSGEGSLGGFAAETWRFRQRVNQGVLWLDDYFEGVLYRETETRYAAITQYDTDSANSIPDLAVPDANETLRNYKDLAVVWSYPTETIVADYASDAVLNIGDTRWTGTRTTYQYQAADQNNSQYGNLTRSVLSYWNGSGWVEYRASKTEYWPRHDSSLYLVSLPARTLQLDCANGCDFSGNTGLLGETLYLYDANSQYSSPPAPVAPDNKAGRLRVQRTLVDEVGSQKRYSETGYGYDSHGNQTSQTTYPGYATAVASPAGAAFTTELEYDPLYHTYLISQTNPLNQVISSGYDYTLGLPTSETDANGAEVRAEYDALGRITAVIRPGDESDNPTLRFSYHIDSQNHLFWTEAQQRISVDIYTKVRKYYNGLGQLLQTQTDAELAGALQTLVSDIYYDEMGRAYKETVPYSRPLTQGAFITPSPNPADYTLTSYDALGRIYQVQAPDGSIQTSVYSLQSDNGALYNLTHLTNARGNTSVTWSDALGRTYRVVSPAGPGVTYSYDAADRLVQAQYGSYAASLSYDFAGRKLSMNDPDMGIWTYQYDALGNLVEQTDARGCVTSLSYDGLNRLLGKSYSNANGGSCAAIAANTAAVSYNYDQGTNGIGRRSGMSDASGSTLWEYDLRGRLTAETVAIGGVGTYTTLWSYNSADWVVGMTYPNGERLSTHYNLQGLATEVESGNWNRYVSQAEYDEAGRLLEWKLGNGVETSRTYYPWDTQGGRLQSTVSAVSQTPTIIWQHLGYTYDANGNLSVVQDNVASETLNYSYDALDRLTSVSGAYSQSYSYDAASGNLASLAGQTLSYTDTAHPHAATGLGSQSYAYDANGNMISRQIASGTYTLSYDAEGRLVSIASAGMSASYTYNGDGARVKAVVTTGSQVKTSAYVGNYFEISLGEPRQQSTPTQPDCSTNACIYLPLAATSRPELPAGQAWMSYYSAGGQRALRVQSNQAGLEDGVFYFLSDHLGSTSLTLDEGAGKVAELRYSAWGETRYTDGSTPTQRRYTGQLEAEAGLYFYQARWYDPGLGRFAQADSIIPLASQGVQAWDRYAYVNNNPVRYNDSSGHCILCMVAAIGGGVLLVTAIYNNFIREPSKPADINASNLGDLLLAGYEHANHANITGEGLQSLQNDPSVQAAQQRLVDIITERPEYRVGDFHPDDISDAFTANGPGRRWYKGAVEGNPAFWMVHSGSVSATDIQVSVEGTMDITWIVTDQFDYLPDWGNSGGRDGFSYWAYNCYASVIHPLYHGVLGARQVPISASWNETKYPTPQ